MRKKVLEFVRKCEGWKTAVKQFHWAAKNMSQHKLCDDVAKAISDFQDQVAEVEQGISGTFNLGSLKSIPYKCVTMQGLIEDIVRDSIDFCNTLKGDDHIGMRSDCESFISEMQKQLYLVNFTLKEDLRRRLSSRLTEINHRSPKNDITKYDGRKPKSAQARINRINKKVREYGIDSRTYTDGKLQALADYKKVLDSLGWDVKFTRKESGDRIKEFGVTLTNQDDGMVLDGYCRVNAAGNGGNPFSKYDTSLIVYPKPKREISEAHVYDDDDDRRETNNLYISAGLDSDNPNPDWRKMDMDRDFEDVETNYQRGKRMRDIHTMYLRHSNPNLYDMTNRRPYTNYLARNSERYMSPDEANRLRRPDLGPGIGNRGDYLDLWNGHNGTR